MLSPGKNVAPVTLVKFTFIYPVYPSLSETSVYPKLNDAFITVVDAVRAVKSVKAPPEFPAA